MASGRKSFDTAQNIVHYANSMEFPARKLKLPAEPRDITDQFLQPIIGWASKGKLVDRYGRKSLIAAEMTKRCKRTVTRQQVSMWLNPNPSARKQPLFGFGILLVAVGQSLMQKKH
jgi:hypothetical protein